MNYISFNLPPRFAEELALATSSFPSGCEEHVHIQKMDLLSTPHVTIRARIYTSTDIMRLLLITDAVRRMGAEEVHLRLPFMPYARQDRVCNPGEALSAVVMADLINSQRYESVLCFDMHSSVMPALIRSCINELFVGHVRRALTDFPAAVLVAPDAGASKRAEETAKACGLIPDDIVQCTKRRVKGAIEVKVPVISGGRPAIIVDDICDGGGTFIQLAPQLLAAGASSVILCVTHGLFTKGITVLHHAGIDRIYTSNSWRDEPLGERHFINELPI